MTSPIVAATTDSHLAALMSIVSCVLCLCTRVEHYDD
jgi:hypothetical protein